MLKSQYKNLITYTLARSGSTFFVNKLMGMLNVLSPNEYVNLNEFFGLGRSWYIDKEDGTVRVGGHKTYQDGEYSWRYVYKNNSLVAEKVFEEESYTRGQERNRLRELWIANTRTGINKYHLKVFSNHMRDSYFLEHVLNTSDNFFFVLMRRDFRKVILSRIIALGIDKWFYRENEETPDVLQRESLLVDLADLDRYISFVEIFYKKIEMIENKIIVDYNKLKNLDTMASVLSSIYDRDIIAEIGKEKFQDIYDSSVVESVAVPYSMDHMDYIKNVDEVFKKFDAFQPINDHYMDKYHIT